MCVPRGGREAEVVRSEGRVRAEDGVRQGPERSSKGQTDRILGEVHYKTEC